MDTEIICIGCGYCASEWQFLVDTEGSEELVCPNCGAGFWMLSDVEVPSE